MKRPLSIPARSAPLAKGTRVVLLGPVTADDDWVCKEGSMARITRVEHPLYGIETTGGHVATVRRDQLVVQKTKVAEVMAHHAQDWQRLADHVVLEVIVGSTAWGLDDADSDEDRRGVFVLPFEDHTSLYEAPDELRPVGGEATYQEIAKVVRLGLRAETNVLEMLWSPLITVATPVGRLLRRERDLFVSKHIHQAFGRYALSQLERVRRKSLQHVTTTAVHGWLRADPALPIAEAVARLEGMGMGPTREAERALRGVIHAAFDRGDIPSRTYEELAGLLAQREVATEPYRPKNAYNLLRLLHSGLSWLRDGVPMIRIEDPALEARLRVIKAGEAPIEEVVAEAQRLSEQLDDALVTTTLPDEPDVAGADALLRRVRALAARRHFALAWPALEEPPPAEPTPPSSGIDLSGARSWLASAAGVDVVACGLSGAHAYGFVSPDSDLDLKGIWIASADQALGLAPDLGTVDLTEVVDGVELDLTLIEAAHALGLLVRGNGNLLEQLLASERVAPWQDDAALERLEGLRSLAAGSVHVGCARHYQGFLRQLRGMAAKHPTTKQWLYAHRVALTGIHLMRTGRVVSHLPTLLAGRDLPLVHELIAAKRAGEEHALADVAWQPRVEAQLDALEGELAQAVSDSTLPEACPNRDALDGWLRYWRTVTV